MRKLTVARALASTVIVDSADDSPDEEDIDMDSVLKDWFEANE